MLVAEKQTNENIVTVNTLAILLDFPLMDSCFLTKRLILFCNLLSALRIR